MMRRQQWVLKVHLVCVQAISTKLLAIDINSFHHFTPQPAKTSIILFIIKHIKHQSSFDDFGSIRYGINL